MQPISKKKCSQIWLGLIFSIILIVIDQVTKYFAVLHLNDAPAVPIIKDVFELQYLENHGAAFGILQGQKLFFILMTSVVLIVLIYLYVVLPDEKRYGYMRFTLTLLISGAIGNFIDRARQDYVIDFFYFKLIDFPIFNVADIYVTVSTGLIILLFFFYYKEEDLDMMLAKLCFWKKKDTN